MDNEKLLNMIITEKNKIKSNYNQKLEDIKKHYDIKFNVEYLKDEKIKRVEFQNLKYKNGYDNLSVIYNESTRNIDYIYYDYTDSRIVKNLNHRKLVTNLERNLKLVIAEIERANTIYLNEIEEIDFAYQNTKQDIEE